MATTAKSANISRARSTMALRTAKSTRCRRVRSNASADDLAAALAPHVVTPKWIMYSTDMKKGKVDATTIARNKEMWQAVVSACGKPVFAASVVEAALRVLRKMKGDDWSLPDGKLEKWVSLMSKRFRCQAKHLNDGSRAGRKWATDIYIAARGDDGDGRSSGSVAQKSLRMEGQAR